MDDVLERLKTHALYAWMGEDEKGSGRIGLKQTMMPAGIIPLVTMDYDRFKIEREAVRNAMEWQSGMYGKKIRLVKFVFAEVVAETESGQ